MRINETNSSVDPLANRTRTLAMVLENEMTHPSAQLTLIMVIRLREKNPYLFHIDIIRFSMTATAHRATSTRHGQNEISIEGGWARRTQQQKAKNICVAKAQPNRKCHYRKETKVCIIRAASISENGIVANVYFEKFFPIYID